VIQLPVGTRIWIAAGVTDLRRGFDGLSAQVQNVLQQQPFSADHRSTWKLDVNRPAT
jgi:transposase